MGNFRTIFSGATPAAGEVWSVGLNWVGPNHSFTPAEAQSWANGIGTGVMAQSSNPLFNLLSSSGNINKVRVEQRQETDDTLMVAAEFTLTTPETGANPATSTLQTSICLSLITARSGRSYRGRVYWPAWAYTPTASLMFGTTTCNTAIDGLQSLEALTRSASVSVDPGYLMVLCVRSRLHHTSEPVTHISAGNVPDTQRRRRDAVNEVYVTQSI